MNVDIRVIDNVAATIGEGPLWSTCDDALYWIDTVNRTLMRLRAPFEQSETRELPYRPSCLAAVRPGELLVVYKKGIGLFRFDSGEARQLPMSGMSFENEILNDGACDSKGRLWVGTRDRQLSSPLGALYRLGSDLAASQHVSGLVVSNGIAFSPDGRTMYHTDSRPGRIDTYDYDVANGAISNKRVFIDYAGKDYHGDGCTTDAEGGLWVAEIGAARVSRYLPDGSLDRMIKLPVRKPTSIAFGGRDMATMFVTSMRYGLSEADLAAMPDAGKILVVTGAAKGIPEATFSLDPLLEQQARAPEAFRKKAIPAGAAKTFTQ